MLSRQGLLAVALAVAPAVAGQDDVGFEPEYRAAVVALVAALEEQADWCSKGRLYAERDRALELLLRFEPDHPGARKTLGHRWVDDGWEIPEDREPALNRTDKRLPEARRRRAALGRDFSERVVGIAGFYERADPELGGLTPERKREAFAAVLLVDPDHPGVRTYFGEARVGERWVLGETERARARRAELKAIVRDAFAAVPAPGDVEPNEVEAAMGVSWTAGVATPRVRVLTTGPRGEAEQVARACHAAMDLYRAVLGSEVEMLEGYTVWLLLDGASRDAFVAGWPGWGPERVEEMSTWGGAGVPRDVHVARWDADEVTRLDGAVRHTLGVLFKLDVDLGVDVAWAWEGAGLYLTRSLVGTRLTWYGSGQTTETPEAKELLGRLLRSDVNWMNEAYQMLKLGRSPPLRALLGCGIDSMGVRDALLAYAWAAYLIEGRPDDLRPILLAVGEGQVPSADAVESTTGRDVDENQARLLRWLSERR